jgi:hypothetical protein
MQANNEQEILPSEKKEVSAVAGGTFSYHCVLTSGIIYGQNVYYTG